MAITTVDLLTAADALNPSPERLPGLHGMIYAHWTFRGKRRATRSLGRARRPCGIVKKRAPFLAARTRYGTWKVYFTAGKKFSRKEFPFYLKQDISRTFVGAGAASVSTGSR